MERRVSFSVRKTSKRTQNCGKTASKAPHNPEVAGSSPAAATKSGCFREKTATFFAFLLENDLGQRMGQVLTHTLTQTARGAFHIRK